MKTEIGAYEAKTRLPELLRQVGPAAFHDHEPRARRSPTSCELARQCARSGGRHRAVPGLPARESTRRQQRASLKALIEEGRE